jgi:hypothetical protein
MDDLLAICIKNFSKITKRNSDLEKNVSDILQEKEEEVGEKIKENANGNKEINNKTVIRK